MKLPFITDYLNLKKRVRALELKNMLIGPRYNTYDGPKYKIKISKKSQKVFSNEMNKFIKELKDKKC